MTAELDRALVVVVAEADRAARAGALADELRGRGCRVAVFAEDAGAHEVDAIVELVAELGRERETQ